MSCFMDVREGPWCGKGRRRMQRSRSITLAAAGTAIVVAALSGLLVVLVTGARPTALKLAVPVLTLPIPHLHVSPVRPSQLLSPFTGEPAKALRRVVVVKIDNIVDARPLTSLTSA